MKKVVRGIIVLSLVSSIVSAGDYYGGVDFGFGKGSEEWKQTGTTTTNFDFSNTAYGLHVGYKFSENSMIESSFKLLTFDFKESRLPDEDGTQFGVDYLYTFNNIEEKLKPYLGIGLTSNTKDITIQNLNENSIDGLGVKLRGGVYYSLTPKLDLGVEFNYNFISWAEVKDTRDNSILDISSTFYGLGLNANYKF